MTKTQSWLTRHMHEWILSLLRQQPYHSYGDNSCIIILIHVSHGTSMNESCHTATTAVWQLSFMCVPRDSFMCVPCDSFMCVPCDSFMCVPCDSITNKNTNHSSHTHWLINESHAHATETEEIGFKIITTVKISNKFAGSPRTYQTRFHRSPQIFIQFFTCVNGVPVT